MLLYAANEAIELPIIVLFNLFFRITRHLAHAVVFNDGTILLVYYMMTLIEEKYINK